MSLIQISDLSFTWEGSCDPVFQHLNLQLDTDWRLGLVGRNGRGKTTLLRLLLGGLEHTGSISMCVKPVYFPEQTDLTKSPLQTAQRLCPQLEQWELERELSLLRVGEDVLNRPLGTLSQGERAKVLLALQFHREGCFPLIDEPTNHLDAHGRALLARYLRRQRGFLLVSHDRALLDVCVTHILALNRSGPEVRRGSFSDWFTHRARQNEAELAQNQRLKKEIGRLEESARRAAVWSDKVEATKKGGADACGLRPDRGFIGAQSARVMKRSKAIERRRMEAAEEKQGLLHDLEQAPPLKLEPLRHHSRRLAALEQVTLSYGGKAVCGPVSLELCQGERVVLTGPNGCGKSSVIKLLAGLSMEHTGQMWQAGGLAVSYVPQDTSFLKGALRDYARREGLEETRLFTLLRKLDFARVQFEKDMAAFSQGQKKKVLLAASLCRPAHLYLWDEPLNYVDVFSRMQVEELLLASEATLLFVEHDQAFCSKVATRTVALERAPADGPRG